MSLQLDGQTSSKNATFGKVGLNPKLNTSYFQNSLRSPIQALSPQIMTQNLFLSTDNEDMSSLRKFQSI